MYLTPTAGAIQQRTARQSGIAGLILLLASLAFVTDLYWLLNAGQLFMLQLPILLLCFAIISVYGLGYILSPPQWIVLFLFGLIYLSQDVTFRASSGGGDMQTVIKGIIAFALLAMTLAKGLSASMRQPVLTIWLAYAAFAMASAAYSSLMILAIGSGIALLAIALASAQIATSKTEALQWSWQAIYWSSLLVAAGSLILMAASPNLARDISDPAGYRLKGITGSANALGPMMAIGAILTPVMFKLSLHRAWRWFYVLMAAAFIAALTLSKSRSSMSGLVAAFIVTFAVTRRQTIWATLIALLLASLSLVVVTQPKAVNAVLGSITKLISRSGDVAELTSFTGRSDIWHASWGLIKAKPWIGYGLGSIRIELPRAYSDIWGNTYSTAHNFVLESLISVGAIGTSMLLLALIWTTFGLIRIARQATPLSTAKLGKPIAPVQSIETALYLTALRCMVFLWVYSAMEKAFAGTVAPATVVLGLCIASYAHAKANTTTTARQPDRKY